MVLLSNFKTKASGEATSVEVHQPDMEYHL